MMTALAEFPVGLAGGGATLGSALLALLRETVELMQRLARYDESGAIDLRSLPFGPGERQRLREVLGTGEVEIILNVDGKSRLWETAFPGVWWVEHRNSAGELVAELLEVTLIPEIAVTAGEEVGAAAARLHAWLPASVPRSVP